MNTTHQPMSGLWLPLITPFLDGQLDETSLKNLLKHYLQQPVDGFILAATTGEGLTLSEAEQETLIRITAAQMIEGKRKIPVYLGISGSDTRKVIEMLQQTSGWPLDGYLATCPYYTRPSQEGLLQHFTALADNADHSLAIYNIPYRTGVNLGNKVMLELAKHNNIIGVKDCCAIPSQSYELLKNRPDGFSVLTGEDAFYYNALVHNANGAILASAHLATSRFADIRIVLADNNHLKALSIWNDISILADLLFTEPSPSAIKHCLWRAGLIKSPEVRLPMLPVTSELALNLDTHIDMLDLRATS